jgi:hypothetical protein
MFLNPFVTIHLAVKYLPKMALLDSSIKQWLENNSGICSLHVRELADNFVPTHPI